MKYKNLFLFSMIVPMLAYGEIRNGDFSRLGTPPIQQTIDNYRKSGLTCPNAEEWPQWWGYIGKDGEFSFPRSGGADNGRFARITGKSALLTGYHALPLSGDFAVEVYLRGQGSVSVGYLSYAQKGNISPADQAKANIVNLSSSQWRRYRFRVNKSKTLHVVHPAFCAISGTVDIDECRIYRDNEWMLQLADAEAVLEGKKFFQDDKDVPAGDPAVEKAVAWFQAINGEFQKFQPLAERQKLCDDIKQAVKETLPYITVEGDTLIPRIRYIDMFLLGAVMQKAMGHPYSFPEGGVSITTVTPSVTAAAPKKEIESEGLNLALSTDKVLYPLDAEGVLTCTFRNSTDNAIPGTLTVTRKSDVDKSHPVTEIPISIPPGEWKKNIPFRAGDRMFGSEIQAVFRSGDSKLQISASEYFQSADEFMRVMMHGTSKYENLWHFFAHEPTDFGVQVTEDREYLSCQPLYKINRAAYDGQINFRRGLNKISFYQNRAFGGIMGYEEVRKHPDYILYEANGQPQKDPIYGGLPDPFELAAPVEREPKRRAELLKGQKFLDHQLTAWHHLCADFTNHDAIRYGVDCIVSYMKHHKMDTVYLDDTPSVQAGYNYLGKHTTRGKSMAELAQMNVAISDLYHRRLRERFPGIGSWCNGVNPKGIRWSRSIGMWERTIGLGVDIEQGKDVNDDYIRNLTSFPNTMFLSEVQHVFSSGLDIPDRRPEYWREKLIEQRDYLIQKYGGNVVFGYIGIPTTSPVSKMPPGPSVWYWPTLNYFHALTVATQHHHILYGEPPGLPSMQPFDQFMTRYSALLWDRNVRTVPVDKVDDLLKTSEVKDLIYRDFVYQRPNPDISGGKDFVIHFVRRYPLEKWDLNWSVQPKILKDLPVNFTVPQGMKVVSVKTMRPYLPTEKTQIVENNVRIRANSGTVQFQLPDFSYYLMVVIRLEPDKE